MSVKYTSRVLGKGERWADAKLLLNERQAEGMLHKDNGPIHPHVLYTQILQKGANSQRCV